MPYLIKDELETHIRDYQIQAITLGDDRTVNEAIEAAIDEVGGMLTPNDKKEWQDGRPHYDVDAIFAATGDDRHALFLSLVKDVAIYRMVPADNTGADYGVITDRYEKALDYLGKLASGKINSRTLPKITTPPADDALPFAMGSRRKFNHDY